MIGTERIKNLLDSGNLDDFAKAIDLIDDLGNRLERVRNLTGFTVPLAPTEELAVWKSDLDRIVSGGGSD